jgi:hypothetical protein
MFASLDSEASIKHAAEHLRALINEREEWFYTDAESSAPFALRRREIEFSLAHGRLILSCLSEAGTIIWRIDGWEWIDGRLLLVASRRMGRERAKLQLIPRASVASLVALVCETRQARCQMLARLAAALLTGARISQARLSAGARRGQPGRDARILLESRNQSIAVTGDVGEDSTRGTDAFLSSALIWFARLGERTRGVRASKLWLVARTLNVRPLAQSLALLRDELRRDIALFELDDEWQKLAPVPQLERAQLWRDAPTRLPRLSRWQESESAKQIVSFAPQAIDVVRARHGETLRFHGLSFARVRCVMNSEKIWFGIEGARRRLLDESAARDWDKLLEDLQEHRRADASDHRHALYRAAPESWLESLLRRDITRLDPGLRLAPLHAQFRTTSSASAVARPVDLLALRRDGRLVVIELKVSEDREHVLQGADYWRRIEAHRRCGNLTRAALFGDAAIADEPPLVYLAAPTLRFHRAFQLLAHSIAPDIKIFRFDLNEDWRAGVRVMRREALTK